MWGGHVHTSPLHGAALECVGSSAIFYLKGCEEKIKNEEKLTLSLVEKRILYSCVIIVLMAHENGDNKGKPRDNTCKACWMKQTL